MMKKEIQTKKSARKSTAEKSIRIGIKQVELVSFTNYYYSIFRLGESIGTVTDLINAGRFLVEYGNRLGIPLVHDVTSSKLLLETKEDFIVFVPKGFSMMSIENLEEIEDSSPYE